MSVYRRTSMPPPRTEVATEDLRHLEVIHRILRLLNEPAASAVALAQLINEMPVLGARLAARFKSRSKGSDRASNALAELTYLGNRDFEAVLFQLLEDLTALRADNAGICSTASILPALNTVRPRAMHAKGEAVVIKGPGAEPARAPDPEADRGDR
jgi:uncharacterized membrane protein YccC